MFIRASIFDGFHLDQEAVDAFVKKLLHKFPDAVEIPGGTPTQVWLMPPDVKAFEQWCKAAGFKETKVRGVPGYVSHNVRFNLSEQHDKPDAHFLVRFI